MPITGDNILHAKGGYEPQRKNNWILQILGLNTLIPQSLPADEFYLSLKSFPFPPESNSVKHIRWWNESRAYAGSVEDFGTQQLTVRDYLDRNTAYAFQAWRRLVWDPNFGSIGFASTYKTDGILYLCPPNVHSVSGDGIQNSRKVFLQGMWPSKFDMGEFDMDNDGDQVEINIELTIDRAFAGDANGSDPTKLQPNLPASQGA